MNLDPFYTELEEKLKRNIFEGIGQGNALDVGCGLGWLTRLLQSETDLNITGIDKNNSNIEQCRLSNLSIEYKQMDVALLENDTFDNSFKVIFCHNVLGYIPKPQEQLFKLSSWLQPGGIISIVTRSLPGRFAEVFEETHSIKLAIHRYENKKIIGSYGDVCQLFSLDELKEMVTKAGLSIIREEGLYNIEEYLPDGYEAMKSILDQSEEYFFHWITCKRN